MQQIKDAGPAFFSAVVSAHLQLNTLAFPNKTSTIRLSDVTQFGDRKEQMDVPGLGLKRRDPKKSISNGDKIHYTYKNNGWYQYCTDG
jgi:hypothetical protein